MKYFITALTLLLFIAGSASHAMSESPARSEQSKKSEAVASGWRYKMTVTIDTPEGEVSGSTVHEMGNSRVVTFPPEAGNAVEASGEAVVVDLGERGAVFALISHKSDLQFYDTFPRPNGGGGETPEGQKYYASLPVGTKATMNPGMPSGYPKLVTFTDMDDPRSIILLQEYEHVDFQPRGQQYRLVADRFEEVFGEGVNLKEIAIEITDEPVTTGRVDQFLPKDFETQIGTWMRSMSIYERGNYVDLLTFKQGE